MSEMPDILKRICAVKRDEIERLRSAGKEPLRRMVKEGTPPRGFRAALAVDGRVALIAEIKKASPSAGLICEDFDPVAIARQYERGGARCISVLTDERFFGGSLKHLVTVREAVTLPVLRKDFILDGIQLLEARAWGADCVLLIVAALDREQLAGLTAETRELGMDALVEVHSKEEVETALWAGADMIGINNRDLRTFEVSRDTTRRLAPLISEGVVVVAESGIGSPLEVRELKACGVDAVLVGESLVRSPDIVAATRALSEV